MVFTCRYRVQKFQTKETTKFVSSLGKRGTKIIPVYNVTVQLHPSF